MIAFLYCLAVSGMFVVLCSPYNNTTSPAPLQFVLMVEDRNQPNRPLVRSDDYDVLKTFIDVNLKGPRGWVESDTDVYIAPTQSARIIATLEA